MWKPLNINIDGDDIEYFFKVEIISEKSVQYFLTDLKRLWKSMQYSEKEVLKKSKELNKRIEFELNAILNTMMLTPKNVEISNTNTNSIQLKIKYQILNRPFNYEWILSPSELIEFHKIVVMPMRVNLFLLKKRNDELVQIIRKKEAEINQYKLERNDLKRVSVVTDPVSNEHFRKTLECDSFSFFTESQIEKLKVDYKELIENSCNENLNHKVKDKSKYNNINTQKSPSKSRKKKIMERQAKTFEKRLRTAEKKITYEDSPSFIEENIAAEETSEFNEKSNSSEGFANLSRDENDLFEIEQSLAELKKQSDSKLKKLGKNV